MDKGPYGCRIVSILSQEQCGNAGTEIISVGMLCGALFWGISADIIGRKFAFNVSLMVCSIFAIIAGSSPNWIVLGLFTCLASFGGGGNLVLDTAVFLEYLPGKQQWLLTMMALWWGIGQLIAGLFAWAFLPNFSGDCQSVATCTYENNKGWRYVWFASGGLVFVMSILRITVIRLQETPKFLLGEGKDEEVVHVLTSIATKYNRPCSLTIERLEACGITGGERRASVSAHARSKWSPQEIWVHLAGLYATKRIGFSTTLIWLSWLLIGLAYPLYNVYLPLYLQSRGAQTGNGSDYETWRNYAIVNVCGIFGPVLAGAMCASRLFWGRRGTMVGISVISIKDNPLTSIAPDLWSLDHHDIFLRLYPGADGCTESGLQLCDFVLSGKTTGRSYDPSLPNH